MMLPSKKPGLKTLAPAQKPCVFCKRPLNAKDSRLATGPNGLMGRACKEKCND